MSIGIYHLFGWVPASKIPRDVEIILGQKKIVLFASRLTAVNYSRLCAWDIFCFFRSTFSTTYVDNCFCVFLMVNVTNQFLEVESSGNQ